MQSIEPSTGKVIATYTAHSLSDATRAVASAATAQIGWRALNFTERGAILNRAATLLRRAVPGKEPLRAVAVDEVTAALLGPRFAVDGEPTPSLTGEPAGFGLFEAAVGSLGGDLAE